MAQKTIIANWKMNLTLKESVILAKKIKKIRSKSVELVICPSYTALDKVSRILHWSGVKLGAQNVASAAKGAYTGEVSAAMLKEVGCQYVILGHSERKIYFNEDYSLINKKVVAALEQGLTPVVCIGESWEERSQGKAEAVLEQQIKAVFGGISNIMPGQMFFCYEPFWTISTSSDRHEVAPQEIRSRCAVIKHLLVDICGLEIVRKYFRVIYGGTVNSQTIKNFLALEDVTGFLVGAASTRIDDFKELINQVD
ncbi:MAG: triose-phosphate isomerase [Patescibacteria group bacterium]